VIVKNNRDESRMASGRLFQVRGPAMANNLSPNEVCVRGSGASHCQLISFLDLHFNNMFGQIALKVKLFYRIISSKIPIFTKR